MPFLCNEPAMATGVYFFLAYLWQSSFTRPFHIYRYSTQGSSTDAMQAVLPLLLYLHIFWLLVIGSKALLGGFCFKFAFPDKTINKGVYHEEKSIGLFDRMPAIGRL